MTMPSRRRASGQKACSRTTSAASGTSTTVAWTTIAWVGSPKTVSGIGFAPALAADGTPVSEPHGYLETKL